MKKVIALIGICCFFLLQVAAQAPNEAESLLNAGKLKLKGNDYYGAVRDFNRALKIQPEYAEALASRAYARNKLGDSDAALADADASVLLAPENSGILYNRAELYFDQKKYKLALDEYNKVLKSDDEYPGAFRGKILSMNLAGMDKDALELVESKIKSAPQESMNYYLHGLLLNLQKKYNKALNDFDKAIELNPGDNAANCYMNRGIAYLSVEENEKALDDLNESIQMDTSNLVAYLSRGRALYNLRNYEQAVTDFSKVAMQSPTNDAAFYNLGMAYFRLDKKTSACQNFHKACSMGNTNSCRMIVMECSEVK